jgi:tetratricopeptide (TPR) repeat protein
MSRLARWAPLGAIVATLAYRAAYFIQIRGNPYFDAPLMDEGYHDLWAREIAHGDWAGQVPFYRAPLYPVLLGLAYRVLGADPPPFAWIRGAQLAIGAITPWLVHRLARRLVPDRPAVAWIAAWITALDGMLLYFEADLLLESLLAPVAVASLWLLLRAGETGSAGRWFAAGGALGVFSVTRPNVLAFAPVLLLAALGWHRSAFSLRRPRVAAGAAAAAGILLWLLPVAAVNRFVGHDRTLVSWQGGVNFFLGNNPESDGWSATAPSVLSIDWWDGYRDAIRIPEEALGRELKPAEVSSYWFSRGLAWWRESPGDALALLGRKVLYFLSGIEFSNNRDIRLFFEEFAPLGRPALLLSFIVIPLALAGAVILWRTGRVDARLVVLWVLVYGATVVAFFVTARYRIPLRPVFAILAALAVGAFVDGIARRDRRAWAAAAAVALAGVAINVGARAGTLRPSPAQFYHTVARIHHEKGRAQDAVAWQLRALAVDPAYPDGNLNLGTQYMVLGRPADAVAAFERERRLDPHDGRNLASLAQALGRLGRWPEAERAYADCEAAGHRDARALYNHGLALERLDRLEDAADLYRRAVEVDSTFADAWNNLGVLAARAGRLDEAVPLWETALARAPGHPRVLENLQRARRMREDGR